MYKRFDIDTGKFIFVNSLNYSYAFKCLIQIDKHLIMHLQKTIVKKPPISITQAIINKHRRNENFQNEGQAKRSSLTTTLHHFKTCLFRFLFIEYFRSY